MSKDKKNSSSKRSVTPPWFIRIYRPYLQRKLRSQVKERLRSYNKLSSIDPHIKRDLYTSIRRYEIQVSALNISQHTIFETLSVVAAFVTLTSFIWGPFCLAKLSSPAVRLMPSLSLFDVNVKDNGYIILTVIVGFLVLIIPFFISNLPKKTLAFIKYRRLTTWWFRILFILSLVICFAIIATFHEETNRFQQATVIGLVVLLIFLSCLYIFSLFISVLSSIYKNRKHALYPDAIIADRFLNILIMLEGGHESWKSIQAKKWCIAELERIAVCVEQHIPPILQSGNLVTDAWMKDTAEQIAAGIRALVKWIFTPKQDTFNEFKVRIADYFIYAVRGDWDSFERVVPQKISKPEFYRTKIKSLLTAAMSSAVPILVLYTLKRLELVEGTVALYLTVGAYIWAALTILSHIDPFYGPKLAALKDISSFLPLKGQDKSKDK